MKQRVDPSVYDEKYYAERYQKIDYNDIEGLGDFDHIYQEAGSMLQFQEQDKIVDFGCGVGHLSLYLYLKYKCDITGVDYSPDALFLCENNLKMLESQREHSSIREKVRFLLFDSDNPPNFKGIKAVFLIDVVEHLHDYELDLILDTMANWRGKKGIQLVIHTDNNNYLRYVRPITDFLNVCLDKTTFQELKRGKMEVAKGHVNLATASKLKRKLASRNFKVLKIKYPSMDLAITKNQLGPITKHWIILYPIFFIGKILYFLRPSFYMLARHENSINSL